VCEIVGENDTIEGEGFKIECKDWRRNVCEIVGENDTIEEVVFKIVGENVRLKDKCVLDCRGKWYNWRGRF